MHTPDSEDEITRALTPADSTVDERLRHVVFSRSTRLLRRRRRRKQFVMLSFLVAAFCAGFGSARLWNANPPLPGVPIEIATTQPRSVTPPAVATEPKLSAADGLPADKDPMVPAEVLERMAALLTSEKRAAYYRAAGDRYLTANDDLRSAIRCFKQALDAAPEMDRDISTEDNWLLMAMKKARQGEQAHAKSNS
jgi:hypothetical protein